MHLLFVNDFHEWEQLEKEVLKNVINASFCLLHYHYHAFIIKQQHFVQPNSLLRIIKVWLNVMRIHPLRIFSYWRMISQYLGVDDDVMIFLTRDVNVFVNVHVHVHVNVVFVNVDDEHFPYN